MQPPPTPIAQNSKKRLLLMDPDVIEIAPPVSRAHNHKQPKRKQVILHEVIDVDNDEDCPDVIILDEKVVDTKNKGKALEDNFIGNNQTKDALTNYLFCQSNGYAPGLHQTVNKDGFSSDLFSDNTYIDLTSDDFMDFDEYTYLQAHFDNVDIPPGVEAPVPNLLDSVQKTKKTVNGSDSLNKSNQNHLNNLGSWPSNAANVSKKPASVSGSGFQIPADSMSHGFGADVSYSWSFLEALQSQKIVTATQRGGSSTNPITLQTKKIAATSSSSTNYSSVNHLQNATVPSADLWGYYTPFNINNQGGTNNLFFQSSPANVDGLNHPAVIGPSKPWFASKLKSSDPVSHPDLCDPFRAYASNEVVARTSKTVNEDTLRKYQHFKRFDTVEGHSDHHYSSKGSSANQSTKNWAKRIQEEWRILENDLPDTIFVRVYESRMDLLRAVIIGAEGTPYHDGLFFFDVFFPSSYPEVPPHVYYHSGGLRLNPNLYNCGKVCLSLLGTWHGNGNEKWVPGFSTTLQLLVSIQALILNQKPFFNEPGYEYMSGSPNGELQSQQYNENTFMLSLRTMVYTMRRPPKHFEDFVLGHFHKHAHDILMACEAYMGGAQVGCLVKGGVQDVNEGYKSCSKNFKDSLPGYVDMLLKEFSQIGIKDMEKFQNLARGNSQAGNRTMAAI